MEKIFGILAVLTAVLNSLNYWWRGTELFIKKV